MKHFNREWLIRGLFRLLAALPLRTIQGLGGSIGWLANWVPNRVSQVVKTNLRLCFPELSHHQQRQLMKRSLVQMGRTTAEIGPLWLWSGERVLGLVREVRGEDAFRQALARGQGIIAAGPHLGAWEVAGLYLSAHYPTTTLYRPPRMEGMEELVRTARGRAGAHLVPTDGKGVRALYQALGQGRVVAILPDHNPGQGAGIFAPFFGIQANTMVLLPRLAARGKSPVFFLYAERLAKGQGYRLHFVPGEADIGHEDALRGCTALNAGVEACIRHCPEQYQWGYKRFKVRPEREQDFYRKQVSLQ